MFNNIDLTRIRELLEFNQFDPLLFGTSLFLFLFAGFLLVYIILKANYKLQLSWLILFSLFFYYKASGVFVLLIVGTAIVNYMFGMWIHKSGEGAMRKVSLALAVLVNLSVLGYFKYANFFITTVNEFGGRTWNTLDIIVPLGISFYTFKSLNYIFDIYYEMMEPEYNFFEFLLFVTFFPNTMSGPIDRARVFLPQIREPNPITKEVLGKAVLLISVGLIKKYAIADYISLNFVDRVFESSTRFTGVENLLAIYGYTLQIFCDFSGYTDMAIGISLLFGFKLMDNFNYPFKAKNVAEFWRRWHISLSTWLQDYLFKPLQMSFRHMRLAGNALAIMLTFVLCGLWHGSTWGFIFWGFLHGFFMSFSLLTKDLRNKFFTFTRLKNTKFLGLIQTVITFHLIAFAFVYFRTPNLLAASDMFNQIINYFHPGVFTQFIEGYQGVFIFMVIGFLFHFLPDSIEKGAEKLLVNSPLVIKGLILGLVIYLVAQVKSADLQPFIYFQF
ncbi:MAG: MBOAT family protein [Ignavibacteriaceae bacterium]